VQASARRRSANRIPITCTKQARTEDDSVADDTQGPELGTGGWRAPLESAPQERLWTGFPPAWVPERAVVAWCAVANAAAQFQPVTMVVNPDQVAEARRRVSAAVELLPMATDDAWLRDSGPTFVLDAEGRLGAVDWIFNGWGARSWARWDHDALVAAGVSAAAGASPIVSTLVNEGGGILVDGQGTVVVTQTVQLDPFRNPYADRARVEAELARTIGATKVIWLPQGLTADYGGFGTRGHVDMVAAIPRPGLMLLHQQDDPAHPDYDVTRRLRAILAASTDATGQPWELRALPAPKRLQDDGEWLDWNYVNHAVVNGGVIACSFDDPSDAPAQEILREAYPGREVVAVDARPIFELGGGIHCITQHQPRAERTPA
jgi:agmatine deiminase